MPQKEQPIGKSSSPIVNRVIQNSHGGQQPVNPSSACEHSFNKEPVKTK